MNTSGPTPDDGAQPKDSELGGNNMYAATERGPSPADAGQPPASLNPGAEVQANRDAPTAPPPTVNDRADAVATPLAALLDELEGAATLELETRAAEAKNGIHSLPAPVSVHPTTALALIEVARRAADLHDALEVPELYERVNAVAEALGRLTDREGAVGDERDDLIERLRAAPHESEERCAECRPVRVDAVAELERLREMERHHGRCICGHDLCWHNWQNGKPIDCNDCPAGTEHRSSAASPPKEPTE